MKIILTALTLSLVSLAAFADEPTPALSMNPAQLERPPNPNVVNREGKKYSVTAGALDPIAVGTNGTAFTGGYFLNRDTLIELRFSNRTDKRAMLPEITEDVVGLQLKRFLVGALYVSAGFNQTKVTYGDKLLFNPGYAATFEGSYTAATLSLGFELQMKTFKFGLEGVGFTQPLESSVDKEEVSQYGEKGFPTAKRKALQDGRLSPIHVYVGASF